MPPYKRLLTDEYKTFKQKFSIVSFIIPNNLRVTTYTEQNFNGILGGPYTGPLHVPQANWFKIWSLKIESLLTNPDDEDSDESDEDGGGKKSSELENNGKEEGNRKENINPEEKMTLESGSEEAEKAPLLKDKINSEMTYNKESGQTADIDKTGKELDNAKENSLTVTSGAESAANSINENTRGGKEGGDRKENINNEVSHTVNAVDLYLAKGNMVRNIININ